MCYAENGTVKFLETLADNVFTRSLVSLYLYTVKPSYVVISIKQPPVLKGHLFVVLS
jgi:hypothetical protein